MFAIEATNISKIYRLYSKPSDRLKEVIFRKAMHTRFETLSNLSFSVLSGESFGIIGDNGAGKSTILKIIAGTLTPTSGDLKIKGRVAALLELGAGFHYEFTGRQNIWINASLMGLERGEIKEKESNIIEFAELGAFIDRPIKTYSSGMVVRLAFSIATSVDPDILIIDEALSVGDQYFQSKCIDRLMDFKKIGKTILFCSHSLPLVNMLCSKTMWIRDGKLMKIGNSLQTTAEYENFVRERSGERVAKKDQPIRLSDRDIVNSAPSCDSVSFPIVYITKIDINGIYDGNVEIEPLDRLAVGIEYDCGVSDLKFWIAAGIWRNDEVICHVISMKKDFVTPLSGKGRGRVELVYEDLPLFHGEFRIVAFVCHESGVHVYHQLDSIKFKVSPPKSWVDELGLLKLKYNWVLQRA